MTPDKQLDELEKRIERVEMIVCDLMKADILLSMHKQLNDECSKTVQVAQ